MRAHGFTLVEMLLVLAVVGLAAALIVPALPGGDRAALEREAARLSALLDSARAQARLTGRPALWQPAEGGFRLSDASGALRDHRWLSDGVTAPAGPLLLSAEPIAAPQRITLARGSARVQLHSDGVRPFALAP